MEPIDQAAYLEWHRRGAVSFTRNGIWAGTFVWLIALVTTSVTLPDKAPFFAFGAFGVIALAAVPFTISYRPSLLRWMLPATSALNAVSGMVAVALGHYVYSQYLGTVMGATILNAVSGMALFRLRPSQAAAAALPYTILFAVHAATSNVGLSIEHVFYIVIVGMTFGWGVLTSVTIDRVLRDNFRQERLVVAERERADRLLYSILPTAIAERLKQGPTSISDRFEAVTVLFADVVGFTPLAASMTPEALVKLLDDVFRRFDELADRHGIEKVKTIGDAYMAVAGLPELRADHAVAMAAFALDLRAAVAEPLRLRIGLATGPVVAGVIGARKFAYDLWGDTVNTAARMESHGLPGEIQVSESTYLALRDTHVLAERGAVEIKGKGSMRTWLLRSRAATA